MKKVIILGVAGMEFHGPISLHMEYQIPGVSDDQGIALSRATDDALMAAAQRNLDTLKTRLHEAYESTELEINQKG